MTATVRNIVTATSPVPGRDVAVTAHRGAGPGRGNVAARSGSVMTMSGSDVAVFADRNITNRYGAPWTATLRSSAATLPTQSRPYVAGPSAATYAPEWVGMLRPATEHVAARRPGSNLGGCGDDRPNPTTHRRLCMVTRGSNRSRSGRPTTTPIRGATAEERAARRKDRTVVRRSAYYGGLIAAAAGMPKTQMQRVCDYATAVADDLPSRDAAVMAREMTELIERWNRK